MDVREKLTHILTSEPEMLKNLNVSTIKLYRLVDKLIANGVTVQEWISVKDRLPDAGAIVLCNTNYFLEILQWDERADMWVDQYQSYRKNYVTHWLPLPQPPKGE